MASKVENFWQIIGITVSFGRANEDVLECAFLEQEAYARTGNLQGAREGFDLLFSILKTASPQGFYSPHITEFQQYRSNFLVPHLGPKPGTCGNLLGGKRFGTVRF